MKFYYLIWRGNLDENLAAFHQINNLQDLNISAELRNWANKWGFLYPNSFGTETYASPLICKNPDSSYYQAVAIVISEPVYLSIRGILPALQELGILLPEGLNSPVQSLPIDWFDSRELPTLT